MSKKAIIYKIKILNWEAHNSSHKKHYKRLMIPNNFTRDAKLRVVPVTVRWMWLDLLLTCSDLSRDSVEYSESMLRDVLESSWSIERALSTLESLQLLTWQKVPLIEENRIEKKEENRIEVPARSKIKTPPEEKDANKNLWGAYFEAYKKRYGVEPVRNASVNAKISQLAKRLGADAVPVVEFFLQHNGAFYLQQTHAIGLCLKDAESLHTQWQKGKAVTGTMAREFEKRQEATSQIEYFRRLSEQAET